LPSDLQLELPLEVRITEPISKIKKKKITWIQKYLWKQLTLSDISFLPQVEAGIWENGSRKA
jgi:ribosomal protein L31E